MGWNDTPQELPPQIANQISPTDFASTLGALGGTINPQAPQGPQQPQPQPQQGGGVRQFLSSMFKNFVSGASEAGQEASGVTQNRLQKAQAAHLDAQTQLVNAQAQQMGQMVTLPNGVTMPYGIAAKAYPAYFQQQGRKEAAQIGADTKTNIAMTPQRQAAQDYSDALDKGDEAGAQFALDKLTKLSSAGKSPAAQKTPNEIGLIIAAQRGDKEAQTALNTLQRGRIDLANARGNAFGKARLWQLQKVYDPASGETKLMTGFDVLSAQDRGTTLIPAGGLSQKDIVSVQQLQSEAKPAIEGVRKNIKAFDNQNDRAVFARVMAHAGTAQYGSESSWMGNVINQALKEGLSPEGQQQAQSLARLAETMGRMRSTLGLPATDQSMATTLALLPGASTPNSQYASSQVDQIEDMIKQAVGIPAYGGAPKTPKPSGQKVKKFNVVTGRLE